LPLEVHASECKARSAWQCAQIVTLSKLSQTLTRSLGRGALTRKL
jgi:hypothetical protein